MRKRKVFLLISCALLSAIISGCGSSSLLGGTVSSTSTDYETQVFNLTNVERTKYGLNPVTWNDKLAQAMDYHCKDMIANNYFDHTSPTGETPGDRATAAGYRWLKVGENIAKGQRTPKEVVDAWMNSPHHRANILDPDFTELGVALEYDSNGVAYWGQLFGTPMP